MIEKKFMENREGDKMASLGDLEGRGTKKCPVLKTSDREDDLKTIEENMIQEDDSKKGDDKYYTRQLNLMMICSS